MLPFESKPQRERRGPETLSDAMTAAMRAASLAGDQVVEYVQRSFLLPQQLCLILDR
jgi:hypothetical protein